MKEKVNAIPIELYTKIYFDDSFGNKYIMFYQDSNNTVYTDEIDIKADIIFEKTINPEIDRHWYTCIKINDKCRNDLKTK